MDDDIASLAVFAGSYVAISVSNANATLVPAKVIVVPYDADPSNITSVRYPIACTFACKAIHVPKIGFYVDVIIAYKLIAFIVLSSEEVRMASSMVIAVVIV